MAMSAVHQLGLFGGAPSGDPGELPTAALPRWPLTERSWLEHAPAWLPAADELLISLLDGAAWSRGRRVMFDRLVDEPRLTAWYGRDGPLPHPLLGELFAHVRPPLRRALRQRRPELVPRRARQRRAGTATGWGASGRAAIVVIVSLGEPRPFLLRPRGGGRSRSFLLGGGDLLVMGGDCQHEFQHSVPKVARGRSPGERHVPARRSASTLRTSASPSSSGRDRAVELRLVAGVEQRRERRAGREPRGDEVAAHDERLGRRVDHVERARRVQQPARGREVVRRAGGRPWRSAVATRISRSRRPDPGGQPAHRGGDEPAW